MVLATRTRGWDRAEGSDVLPSNSNLTLKVTRDLEVVPMLEVLLEGQASSFWRSAMRFEVLVVLTARLAYRRNYLDNTWLIRKHPMGQ